MADFPIIGDVRGAGLLSGVEMVEDLGSRTAAPELAKALITRCGPIKY